MQPLWLDSVLFVKSSFDRWCAATALLRWLLQRVEKIYVGPHLPPGSAWTEAWGQDLPPHQGPLASWRDFCLEFCASFFSHCGGVRRRLSQNLLFYWTDNEDGKNSSRYQQNKMVGNRSRKMLLTNVMATLYSWLTFLLLYCLPGLRHKDFFFNILAKKMMVPNWNPTAQVGRFRTVRHFSFPFHCVSHTQFQKVFNGLPSELRHPLSGYLCHCSCCVCGVQGCAGHCQCQQRPDFNGWLVDWCC